MSFRRLIQFRNIDAFKSFRAMFADVQARSIVSCLQVRDMVVTDIVMDSALSSVNIDPSGVINGPQVNVMSIN